MTKRSKGKPKKIKLNAAQRGYLPRARAARGLRDIADMIERANDGQLCRFALQTWFVRDDGSRVDETGDE